MIGVNSLHSAGRLRSRSLCTVRYGRDFRMMDPFRYPRTPRSRSLKPLVFPDLLGKAQDGQNHPQARKRRKVLQTLLCFTIMTCLHLNLMFSSRHGVFGVFWSFVMRWISKPLTLMMPVAEIEKSPQSDQIQQVYPHPFRNGWCQDPKCRGQSLITGWLIHPSII